MPDMRNDDASERTWFRSRRLYQERGYWYFNTREGTIEGPFPDKSAAGTKLECYAQVMGSLFVPSFELSLVPKL